jgi:sugar phosphate permease
VRPRWTILAAGTFAQAGYVSLPIGLTVLAPALRARFGLSLAETGVVLAAPNVGAIATFYPWGLAVDRLGERAVIGVGLGAASVCVAASAYVSTFAQLATLLLLAGGLGAGVSSASGRAVMHWFGPRRRGLALGVRQTAVPLAGVWVALALPLLSRGDHPRAGLLALAAACLAGAVVGSGVIREGPAARPERVAPALVRPLRDRRILLLSAAGSLLVEPQTCLVGFFVLFLHEHRGMSTAGAAAALAVLNVLGVATRIGAGRWSDFAASRIGPLRLIAVVSAALVIACTLVLSGPLGILVPLLVLMGCVTISWNGLAFAAAAELGGLARSGAALGVQQTALAASGAVLPIAFGAFVAATSWRVGFAVSSLFPLAGWRLLRGVPG